jgi:signal transduction histidine kinase/ligand-binding sensor domain-containing protein
VFLANTAHAAGPGEPVSRYTRDQWGMEQGYPGGPVYSITQTADGYLWLGTQKGLVRFDGFNFHLVQSVNSAEDLPAPILGLVTGSFGNLWIRPRDRRLVSYHDGIFRTIMRNGVTAMCRGKTGEIIFSVSANGIFRERAGALETLALTGALPNFLVLSLAETSDGKIWVGTRDAGLFVLSEGKISNIGPGLPDRKVNCLLAAGGQLWIGTDGGVGLWDGATTTKPTITPQGVPHVQALAITQDREGNVWVGTSGGLLRVGVRGGTLENSRKPPGDAIMAVFEDREGNIWTGSASGVQRLRNSVFVTYSTSEGLPSDGTGPVYAGTDDRTWFAPTGGGLYWVREGQIGKVKEAGLGEDVVYSIAGGNGELWIGRQRGGLTHLSLKADSWVSESYTQAQGLAQNSVYSVYRTRDGTIWAGTLSGGVSKLRGGKLTTYTISNGLASDTVTSILEAPDGTIWFATPNGLSALSNGRWQAFSARDGLPSQNVNCLLEDSKGVLWVGTAAGLAFFNSGRIQTAHTSIESLHEQIFGLAEDQNGSLWIATSNHVLRVNRDHLLQGALGERDVREFGLADGLRGTEGVKRHRSVVADSLGRIWISTNRGLSVVNPARLMSDSAPALVHIQTISADGATIDLRSGARIPGGHKRITFGYAGLNLTVPERVQFKYTLDPFDHGWNGPVTRRDATYTNLSPGSYRFRVIANNSDGLWNGSEAAIGFDIDPVFWQTWWFRVSVVLGCALAALLLYRFRLHQLTGQLNVRFEERLAERTRIAQDLHDTLLQGFLSASMQLHVAVEQLPDESPARPSLSRILELMGRVIEEGRNAVRGLRSSPSGSLELEQALARIQEEFATETHTGFYIIVEGKPRPLHPVLRDEVYRISREALVNAFRHSRAKKIEVQLEYGFTRLRVQVRDDGCGIDPEVLRAGREGHWGLPGMRERAERIGAKLHVWSSATAGTEVELSVPSHIAFQDQRLNGMLGWLSKLYSRKNTREK